MRGISASWLLTGDPATPPIAAGALVLDDDGRVLAVGELSALRGRFPSLAFEQQRAVLMPGLVNAHAHLELSGLRGAVPGGRGFVPWVDTMIRVRAERQPEADAEAIDVALSELLGFGVVALGDVSNSLQCLQPLAALPLLSCIFHEVFGRSEQAALAMRAQAEAERAQHVSWPAHVRYALAPHTPFTLHGRVLQSLVRAAADGGVRTSLHLAEHGAERAFLENGSGPFADWIAARGAGASDWQPPGCDAVRYVDRLGILGPQLIAVHLTDARPDELAIVAERQAQVVLCPRSNLHIELKLPPLLDILRTGIRPGLGSDSLASNASLDPLAEARALHKRFPTVRPLELLAMATSWGADALGLGHWVGRLQPELYPGVIAFEHTGSPPADPARFVLQDERAPRHVLVRPAYQRLAAEPGHA
jgi:cytosine/adenosine deaminase-related metal-dependent hydrolase